MTDIVSLPDDVLLLIFDYCDEYDLLWLSRVCRRFREIVHMDTLWIKKCKRFLVTNQVSERFRERCYRILPLRSTCQVSQNWQHGMYKEETVFTREESVIPWLKMTKDTLWWCGDNELLGLDRNMMIDDMALNYTIEISQTYSPGGICKFVLWKDFIICGYRNGHIIYFLKKLQERKCSVEKILLNNSSCVNAIDATSENVIAGLENGIIKIWRHPDMDMDTDDDYDDIFDESEYRTCINLWDKVRSLSIDPTGVKFAVGSDGTTDNIPPLHIIDIERYTEVGIMQHYWRRANRRRRRGILDMVWDDPNTLLTCGYDKYIRKWDLRTKSCVSSWEDPTKATIYCISSDHRYTMITGTEYDCLAVLWDQRKSDFVERYYMNSRVLFQHGPRYRINRLRRSPIYSVQFDNTHLYCATDRRLLELNFENC